MKFVISIATKQDSSPPGKIVIGGAEIRSHLQQLKEGLYVVDIKGYRRQISDKQRSVWWIWMRKLAQKIGHTVWYLHWWCKLRFSPNLEFGPDGMPSPQSMMDNTALEQSEVADQVRQWAWEFHGVRLDYLNTEDSERFIDHEPAQGS